MTMDKLPAALVQPGNTKYLRDLEVGESGYIAYVHANEDGDLRLISTQTVRTSADTIFRIGVTRAGSSGWSVVIPKSKLPIRTSHPEDFALANLRVTEITIED